MAARVGRGLTLLCVALAAAGAGCKSVSDPGANGKVSDRLVNFHHKPPYVNALEIDPVDKSFLLTTNRGFYRISSDGKKVTQIHGVVTTKYGSTNVGTYLEIHDAGPGKLMGSGHPDRAGKVPPFLGFIRSDDDGKTWHVVSRLGTADLHQIRQIHGKLYAFDAVLGAILVSDDGGNSWVEHYTPRQLVLDFVVDPDDENHLLASVANQLYVSKDRGDKWRPAGIGSNPRLAWPAEDTLMRADTDGFFQVSSDGGVTWKRRGRMDGEPWKILALDANHAFIALSDGTILETKDGGKSFQTRFRP